MATSARLLLAACMIHALSLAHGYQFRGCFADTGTRDLPVLAGTGSMSIGKCNQLCTSRQFQFFGVQYSNECYCGNSYGRYGAKPSGDCNMRCSGDRGAFCGAGWRNSVYQSDHAPGLQFIGCFVDGGNRDLPVLAGTGGMSILRCYGLCRNRDFAFFGVQNGDECWCGNGYGMYGARKTGECSTRCSGDRGRFCGAGWRNSVYTTGLSPLHVPSMSHASEPTVRDNMVAQIKSQYVAFPAHVLCDACFISGWRKRNADVKSKVFAVRDMASVMSSFPAKVRSKVQALQFGANAKTTFEDFHVQISNGHAIRTSYIGMAKRVNGNVQLGMVAVELDGNLVQKYNVYKRQVCRKILWVFRKCSTHTHTEPRGFHASEINQIDQALRSETFRLFGEKVGQVTV